MLFPSLNFSRPSPKTNPHLTFHHVSRLWERLSVLQSSRKLLLPKRLSRRTRQCPGSGASLPSRRRGRRLTAHVSFTALLFLGAHHQLRKRRRRTLPHLPQPWEAPRNVLPLHPAYQLCTSPSHRPTSTLCSRAHLSTLTRRLWQPSPGHRPVSELAAAAARYPSARASRAYLVSTSRRASPNSTWPRRASGSPPPGETRRASTMELPTRLKSTVALVTLRLVLLARRSTSLSSQRTNWSQVPTPVPTQLPFTVASVVLVSTLRAACNSLTVSLEPLCFWADRPSVHPGHVHCHLPVVQDRIPHGSSCEPDSTP